ncbi:MAG: metallophosphoesterase [Acetobacteraceae bacterium]|nr:metallophosphoesterase [Acetobacteraceae bacterium]
MQLELAEKFAGIRVVGDVHGEARQFRAAIEGARAADLFVLQLGDLTDRGPDDAGALRLMLDLLDQGAGAFLLGNHDRRLLRALMGHQVKRGHGLEETLAALDAAPDLIPRAAEAISAAPAWLRRPGALFVHGALHPEMLLEDSPPLAYAARTPALAFALYGETSGRKLANGMPERLYGWVDRIPRGITVFCGHDVLAHDGRPQLRAGAAGGRAVFVDTGAGKQGHLSWIDLTRNGERAA